MRITGCGLFSHVTRRVLICIADVPLEALSRSLARSLLWLSLYCSHIGRARGSGAGNRKLVVGQQRCECANLSLL